MQWPGSTQRNVVTRQRGVRALQIVLTPPKPQKNMFDLCKFVLLLSGRVYSVVRPQLV